MRALLLPFLLLISSHSAPATAADFPPGSPDFATSYEAATQRAAKSRKPILLIFSAGYCPPCQLMLKTVYPSPQVAPLHSKFEWAYIDVSQPESEATVRKFDVQPIPHLQFLTPDSKPFSNWIGHATALVQGSFKKGRRAYTSAPN